MHQAGLTEEPPSAHISRFSHETCSQSAQSCQHCRGEKVILKNFDRFHVSTEHGPTEFCVACSVLRVGPFYLFMLGLEGEMV
ncbi:hypothetical protein KCU83_g622, partial [Aureobasidium melanogenum]